VSLRDLYGQYSNRVQFLAIYIREAHPADGWRVRKTDIYDPKTMEERRGVAGGCAAALQYGIPTLVDGMDDAVMTAYAAWPERLYLVDLDGRVAYAGGPGPFWFKPKELKKAIDAFLADYT
jgi:hypothetical protein